MRTLGSDDSDALAGVITLLKPLDPEDRERVLRALCTFFDFPSAVAVGYPAASSPRQQRAASAVPYSEEIDLSPKEFLVQKQPRTDVERIACLAYYLTHYRDTPHFKTLDLSRLNTEAAQPKFSNAAWASNNAIKRGYLASAPRGSRQLSAGGEQFVSALPDRDAAKKAMDRLRPKRHRRRRKSARGARDQRKQEV